MNVFYDSNYISNIYNSKYNNIYFIMFDRPNLENLEAKPIKNVGKYHVSQLSDYTNTIILDPNLLKEKYPIINSYRPILSTGLDSNIVGRLSKKFDLNNDDDKKFIKYLTDLKKYRNNIDCNPYLIENILIDSEDEHVLKSIIPFTGFKNTSYSDMINFKKNIDKNESKKILSLFDEGKKNMKVSEYYWIMYIILLLATSELLFDHKSIVKKMKFILDFIASEKLPYLEAELYYAYLIIDRKNHKEIQLFAKPLQLGSNLINIKKRLRGMARDISLIKYEVLYMSDQSNPSKHKFILREIATQDQGLNNLLKLNPINAIAIVDNGNGNHEYRLKYKYNIWEELNSKKNGLGIEMMKKFQKNRGVPDFNNLDRIKQIALNLESIVFDSLNNFKNIKR
ncbi:hypothetical protein WR164_03390 [Philodulcilactobacillus myokoensis]|uniref:Uncharacterized protein n=1 Tax=Philodulcilactobacillus myokoensis TaxID=2929573 RepID=A0A9W6AZS7_9LACO|nr:hypothetical protein WR164_03390 [Philodulcilactobacillus myokoensis]